MTRNEIKDQLQDIIRPYVSNPEKLAEMTEQSDLLKDLEINSAHLVDIILDMEEGFDIEIDDKAAEQMLTVGQALDVTENLLAEK
ncbi:MAG: acyl carrier protein [Schleiferiaceae bacterium]|nr:acyl carrier protein [Schleiferiaceae bacterium]MDR9442804.1 acyl carrier protein [Schleiferiaceae bacterium]